MNKLNYLNAIAELKDVLNLINSPRPHISCYLIPGFGDDIQIWKGSASGVNYMIYKETYNYFCAGRLMKKLDDEEKKKLEPYIEILLSIKWYKSLENR